MPFQKGQVPKTAFKKGNVSWNKGLKMSDEARRKMSVAQKGKPSWRKGKSMSLESRLKMSEAAKIKYKNGYQGWNKGTVGIMPNGKKSHFWKGGISKINYTANFLERLKFKQQIQKKVFERDNYKCVLCGEGGDLQVDHIQSWAEYVELRFNIENCRTLCQKCHYQVTFGKPMPPTVRTWGHNFSKGGTEL